MVAGPKRVTGPGLYAQRQVHGARLVVDHRPAGAQLGQRVALREHPPSAAPAPRSEWSGQPLARQASDRSPAAVGTLSAGSGGSTAMLNGRKR